MKIPVCLLLFVLLFSSCQETKENSHQKHLGNMTAMAEMVAADVKPLALSVPLTSAEADALWHEASAIAENYGVEVFRETDLIKTMLFSESVADGKEVLVFHKANALEAYLDLKKTIAEGKNSVDEARRFGRLLGYPNQHINTLLAKNTEFRSLPDFGILGTNVFLYYKDLAAAKDFYHQTLGMEIASDYGFAVTLRISHDAFLTLVDEAKGMHKASEPKTVAIALLTDQLPEWYAYLQGKNVPIKYTYKPKENNAHDGFVAIDPEGYLLEFEMFKQHEENELLIPQMRKFPALPTALEGVAAGLGFYGAVTWTYYQDMPEAEKFYEEIMGLRLIVDQGWAKVYQVSETGYIGLVDERRGMHTFSGSKAVNVSFLLGDVSGWFDYIKKSQSFPLRQDSLEVGPEGKYKGFVGFDPGGYFVEFDQFFPHPDNERLLEYLGNPQK
ncbi:VOC family protein [Aquiflexum sp. TKW24L]|uniref:VOC family protein n=1 Tax=Aquiflexum sp. TKW24L TaxID=2942212 RepID=UPI0020C0321A|nr:VOC family protein [Aquiflexum sp. TKW24L]MCL6261699.1 VOC family protein [Aquiflexum sp. TKW24L]